MSKSKVEKRRSQYSQTLLSAIDNLVVNIDGYISEFEDGTVHVKDGITLEEERECVAELRKMVEKLRKGKFEGIIRYEVLDAHRNA